MRARRRSAEVCAEAEEGERRAQKHYFQIRPRRFKHLARAAREAQHVVREEQARGDEQRARAAEQDEGRGERALRLLDALRAEEDGDARRAAYADEQREGYRHEHRREGDRYRREPRGADVVADEYPVHDVVYRARDHADDGRQREAHHQLRHGLGFHKCAVCFRLRVNDATLLRRCKSPDYIRTAREIKRWARVCLTFGDGGTERKILRALCLLSMIINKAVDVNYLLAYHSRHEDKVDG